MTNILSKGEIQKGLKDVKHSMSISLKLKRPIFRESRANYIYLIAFTIILRIW